MEASTQTENVYGLQPIESKLEELQDKITSMNKKCKLHIFWVVFEERSKIINPYKSAMIMMDGSIDFGIGYLFMSKPLYR